MADEKPDDVKIPEPKNEVCRDCLKWDRYGETCRVYWENKKYCTMKVRTMEEWNMESMMIH